MDDAPVEINKEDNQYSTHGIKVVYELTSSCIDLICTVFLFVFRSV